MPDGIEDDIEDKVTIGRLMGPFGIKGEMRVMLDDISPERLVKEKIACTVQKNGKILTAKSFRAIPKGIAVTFHEITDRNIAEDYPKSALMIPAHYLPPVENAYLDDIVGFRVYNLLREDIAEVINLYNFGAGDVLEMKFSDGKIVMVPDNPDIILEIEYDTKVILVSKMIDAYYNI
ncbi:MAG: ribosome maturation factor RimM [Pseudomonadota bacterium]